MDDIKQLHRQIGLELYERVDDSRITSVYVGEELMMQHRPQMHHMPFDSVNVLFGRYPEGNENDAYQINRGLYRERYEDMEISNAATVVGSQKMAEVADSWISKINNANKSKNNTSVEFQGNEEVIDKIIENMRKNRDSHVKIIR